MKQIHADRLAELMNVVETIPPDSFNIEHWADFKDIGLKPKSKTVELKCGTTGCAVGWATLASPVWKRAFFFDGQGNIETKLKDKTNETNETFDDIFDAVGTFLDITEEEVVHMFCETAYNYAPYPVSPSKVLEHCQSVLGTHGYVWG